MSDFGIFASRFQVNNETLKEFEDAIRYIRIRQDTQTPKNDEHYTNIINNILVPITHSINGKLSDSLYIENQNIVEILRNRKSKTWPTYKNEIVSLQKKISIGNLSLSEYELTILSDIADAMDIECSKLFKRMRRFL